MVINLKTAKALGLTMPYHRHDDWGTYFQEMERAAPLLGLTFAKLPVERADDLDRAFASAVRQQAKALVVFPDAITFGARTRIARLAVTHKLPTVFAAPGDLPVQQPTRLQLVVNLRTATVLGLTIPTSFLSRADEVLK